MWRRSLASVEAITTFEAPWVDGRPSLHDVILKARTQGHAINEAVREALPPPGDGDNIRFAPGALDSLMGGPGAPHGETDARRVAAAIGKVLREPSKTNAAHLYALLRDGSTLGVIDEVVPRTLREIGGRYDPLAALARRLVREARDVEVAKAAIALLGVSGGEDDVPLVATMGAYDELTLYSVVAFGHLLKEPEQAIWQLAKTVHGWGRIAAVEHLAETQDPAIKAWLLREGFRNTIMYEETAYTCATAGGLREAISAPEVDDELLVAAGEILSALVAGRPGTPIEEYDGGAAATLAFLRHMTARPFTELRTIEAAVTIKSLIEGGRDRLSAKAGWTAEVLLEMKTLVGAVLRSPVARQTVETALAGADDRAFNRAADVAKTFGIDAWPVRLARQKSLPKDSWNDQWWWLMQTDDPERIEQVLALARAQLDLNLIGSGPTTSLGLGTPFKDDNCLDFVVQDLDRFPGRGWDLIKVALRGRSVRLRNMAINALRDWGRQTWPPDAVAEVETAERREPDEKVRARLNALLNGTLNDGTPE